MIQFSTIEYSNWTGAMNLEKQWFTETYGQEGSAFSLEISRKLHEERTPYQHIEIYETKHFGHLMVIDGCVMLSGRDNFFYHEMLTHPALFSHVNPRNVLIIGGGDCGTLLEVLKHESVQKVWQVEIDERVTRLAEQYFPELCVANNDKRASIHFNDGIKWIMDASAGSLDVIIIDSTDPIGPAEGLFTEPFYRNCFRALRPGGILVQQSESPLYHMRIINDMRKAMKISGFSELLTINFPQCVYPSGWWSATLAGKATALTNIREQDIVDRPFVTRYYNLGIHQAAMASPEFMLRAFE